MVTMETLTVDAPVIASAVLAAAVVAAHIAKAKFPFMAGAIRVTGCTIALGVVAGLAARYIMGA